MSDDAALVELLHYLRRREYRHIVVTPTTHAIVLSRPLDRKPTLVDIFGWSRPFEQDDVDPLLYDLLERAGVIDIGAAGKLRSAVRVASLDGELFIHSAYPTDQVDSVFFGPDTYRFAHFIKRQAFEIERADHIADMGAGSGAGGVVASRLFKDAKITMIDVNSRALGFASINAAAAGLEARALRSKELPNDVDLMIANPPYIIDNLGRSYRDGGNLFGGAISLDWIRQGLKTVRPGGRILMYTGAAYVDGRAPLLAAIEEECLAADAAFTVEEIDPDVFGEQLLEPGYKRVERLAAVGVTISTSGDPRYR